MADVWSIMCGQMLNRAEMGTAKDKEGPVAETYVAERDERSSKRQGAGESRWGSYNAIWNVAGRAPKGQSKWWGVEITKNRLPWRTVERDEARTESSFKNAGRAMRE